MEPKMTYNDSPPLMKALTNATLLFAEIGFGSVAAKVVALLA